MWGLGVCVFPTSFGRASDTDLSNKLASLPGLSGSDKDMTLLPMPGSTLCPPLLSVHPRGVTLLSPETAAPPTASARGRRT